MHIYDKQCVIMHKINGRVQTFRFCVLTMGRQELCVENAKKKDQDQKLGDNGATNHHHHHPKLQTALALVLDELEGNQKKENHPNTISKMMSTLVHVQLYTFSYRKAVIEPRNLPKTAEWG